LGNGPGAQQSGSATSRYRIRTVIVFAAHLDGWRSGAKVLHGVCGQRIRYWPDGRDDERDLDVLGRANAVLLPWRVVPDLEFLVLQHVNKRGQATQVPL
jgi:hypothetical protein